MIIRIFAFSTWVLLVSIIIFAILKQDRFFAISADPLATIRFDRGEVFRRPYDSVKWMHAVDKQVVYDGDFVSTGADAKARVIFDQGRSLDLAENTQVQLTSILDQSGSLTFKISLGRGSVVAKARKCGKCGSLILRSGGETYNVDSGTNVGVFKKPGKKSEKFDITGPVPNLGYVKNEAPLISSVLLSPSEVEVKKPSVQLPRNLKPETSTATEKSANPSLLEMSGKELDIGGDPRGKVWWVFDSFYQMSGVTFEVPIEIPNFDQSQGSWRPLVEISGQKNSQPIILDHLRQSDRLVSIPIEKIQHLAVSYENPLFIEYVFGLRGGVQLRALDGSKRVSWRSRQVFFRVKQFHSSYPGALSIYLDKFDISPSASLLFEQKPDLQRENSSVIIHLKSGNKFAKILPALKNAGAFRVSLEPKATFSEDGVFVVDESIEAEIFSKKRDVLLIKQIMSLLDGRLAFSGKSSAFSENHDSSPNGLVHKVGSLLEKGQVIYVLKRNKLYPVNRDFIKNYGEVAKFVDKQARAIFLDDVEIIATR